MSAGAASNLSETLIAFTATLRKAGVRADLHRVDMFFDALGQIAGAGLHTLYVCGRITLCTTIEEVRQYDACFKAFFLGNDPDDDRPDADGELISLRPSGALPKRGNSQSERERREEIGAASDNEVLRRRNFSSLSGDEERQVFELIARLRGAVASQKTRRFKPFHHGQINVRRTARAILSHAGEPRRLYKRAPRRRPRPRVLLVDISGSMAPYAGGLLRFAYAAFKCAARATEVFTMGTRLTRVTPYLRGDDPSLAIEAASKAIPDWSGGTRIGEQLRLFLDQWGQRGMARGALVIIFSDGWERGGADLLREQMQRLRLLARRIIWSNPHKSSAGFEPLTAGMRAALPFLHDLVAGSSAAELATLIGYMGEA